MFSMFSKSKKSEGQSAVSGSAAGGEEDGMGGGGEDGDDDDYETGQDPVIAGLSSIFDEMGKAIKSKGHDRVQVLNQLYN